MRTFRAYLLDDAGRIKWGEWIEAPDQAAAEAEAKQLCRDGVPTVELWEGARLLGELPCEG
jgi:hypothetical protein